jgi:hypothetical protein
VGWRVKLRLTAPSPSSSLPIILVLSVGPARMMGREPSSARAITSTWSRVNLLGMARSGERYRAITFA